MTAPTLVEFETALRARLETVKRPSGPFRVVKGYQGELAALVRDQGFDGPALWVHLDHADDEWHTESSLRRKVEVHLFVASANYRSEDARRKGADGAGEVGSYGLIDAITAALLGHDLGLAIQPLVSLGFHSIIEPEQAVELAASVYRYDWLATWTAERPETEPDAVDHERSHIEIDLWDDGVVDLESDVEHA